MQKAVDVLVFGSANVDFMTYVARLPSVGETIRGTKFETCYGGKGANQCVCAAKLGARTALIAKMGGDSSGTDYIKYLQNERVNVDYVEQLEGESTGMAQISVSDSGDNNIIIVAGANLMLNGEDVVRANALFEQSKILLCQLEVPVDATIVALRNFQGTSILNAAPAVPNMPIELLQLSTIFCVNTVEAGQIAGLGSVKTLQDAKAAIHRLIEMGANTVIITMGALGAVYSSKDTPAICIHVPAHPVTKVVDTTGAGDAFIGALGYYMARFPRLALYQKISAANAIAAYSIQYRGTQTSYPNSSKVMVDLCARKLKWREI